MAQKLYNTKFVVVNVTKIVACQLHSDWLQMTRFLVVLAPMKHFSYFYTLLVLHKPFHYLNNLSRDHISWENTFQSHTQSVAMQPYIEHCKDYYVGKHKTNAMCGIDHESKILLDHPYDINSLTQMHLTTIVMSILKKI
jgi:hypothetical protein